MSPSECEHQRQMILLTWKLTFIHAERREKIYQFVDTGICIILQNKLLNIQCFSLVNYGFILTKSDYIFALKIYPLFETFFSPSLFLKILSLLLPKLNLKSVLASSLNIIQPIPNPLGFYYSFPPQSSVLFSPAMNTLVGWLSFNYWPWTVECIREWVESLCARNVAQLSFSLG